jgi:hypothetical protein
VAILFERLRAIGSVAILFERLRTQCLQPPRTAAGIPAVILRFGAK